MSIALQFITGVAVGLEFVTSEEGETFLVIDALIVRLIFVRN